MSISQTPQTNAASTLTLGVLVDRDWLSAWEAGLLEDIARLGVKLDVIVRCTSIGLLDPPPKMWKWASAVDHWLSRKYFNETLGGAHRDLDARYRLSDLQLEGTRIVDRSDEFEVKASAARQPVLPPVDIVVDLTKIAGQVPTGLPATIGTLRLAFGARSPVTGEHDGSAEVLGGEPHSACHLEFVPADGSEPVKLARYFRTYRFSWAENLRRLHVSGSVLLLDTIRTLATGGQEGLRSRMPVSALDETKDSDRSQPRSSANAVLALPTTLMRAAGRALQRLTTHDQWRIYLRRDFQSIASIKDYSKWDPIVPPANRMWADPFVKCKDGRTFIFAEELELSTNKGVIVCLEYSADGIQRLGVVIEEPHHLSYPFLLEYGNELFMLPESSASKRTQLWKCVEFPLKWERRQVVLPGVSIVDSTVFAADQTWWLFATMDRAGRGDLVSELHIFFADDPTDGSWRPHPLNPVVVDDRCARMAGTIGRFEGQLVRFAQGSGREYGEVLQLRRITELSKTAYTEEKLDTIWPDAGDIGLHHFSKSQDVAVIDACVRMPRPGLRGSPAKVAAMIPLAPRSKQDRGPGYARQQKADS